MTWAHALGILSEGVWDEQALRDFDLALCAAGLQPNGSPEELDLGSQWLVWGTYGDDYYPRVFGRDYAGARVSNNRLKALMPVELSVPSVLPANALERGLADLWVRTAGPMALAAAAAVPARRREDARQLAVGAGQPSHEPHPGPGGLRRDAPAARSARTSR